MDREWRLALLLREEPSNLECVRFLAWGDFVELVGHVHSPEDRITAEKLALLAGFTEVIDELTFGAHEKPTERRA